jgi:hypothetical protein
MNATVEELQRVLTAARAGRVHALRADRLPGVECRWVAKMNDCERFAFLRSAYQSVATVGGLRNVTRSHFEWFMGDNEWSRALEAERLAASRRVP